MQVLARQLKAYCSAQLDSLPRHQRPPRLQLLAISDIAPPAAPAANLPPVISAIAPLVTPWAIVLPASPNVLPLSPATDLPTCP